MTQKLFSLHTGSKLYGTTTPESDTDILHIVLPDLDDLLMGKKVVTTEKKTNKLANTKNTKDDTDEKFVPIHEFAYQFLIGDTVALELAFAIDYDHCGQTFYTMNGSPLPAGYEGPMKAMFIDFVHELRTKFLTSQIRSMVSYLINQSQLYSIKGDRLNCARAVHEVLKHCIETEPTDARLGHLYETHEYVRDRFTEIEKEFPEYFSVGEYEIATNRMAPCARLLGKTLPFVNTAEKCMETVNGVVSRYGNRAQKSAIEGKDWKAYMHAMRIVDEGLTLLKEGRLQFPLEQGHVDRLLQIKRGEIDYDTIKTEFNFKVELLEDLEKTTHLQPMTDELRASFEPWMKKWLRRFYRIQ